MRAALKYKYLAQELGIAKEEVGLAGSPTRVVSTYHPKISRQTEFDGGREIDKGLDQVVEQDLAVL